MGVNPYHELNRDIPIANGRYRMLLHHLQSYTKYGSAIPFHNTPNFGLFCAASQVQLDAQADAAVDTLNVFARLPLRPQATKRERELLLCHVKLPFWRSTAAITLTARRPEIKGGVLLMPCDIGRVDRIAAEDPPPPSRRSRPCWPTRRPGSGASRRTVCCGKPWPALKLSV